MFLGWYDPDQKKPVRAKLADAIVRYEDKFSQRPTVCLTSPQDAAALAEPSVKFPSTNAVQIEARDVVARFTYYVGQDEDANPAVMGGAA